MSPVRSWSTAQWGGARLSRLSKQMVLFASRRERRNHIFSAEKIVSWCPDNNFLTGKLLVAGDSGQRLKEIVNCQGSSVGRAAVS